MKRRILAGFLVAVMVSTSITMPVSATEPEVITTEETVEDSTVKLEEDDQAATAGVEDTEDVTVGAEDGQTATEEVEDAKGATSAGDNVKEETVLKQIAKEDMPEVTNPKALTINQKELIPITGEWQCFSFTAAEKGDYIWDVNVDDYIDCVIYIVDATGTILDGCVGYMPYSVQFTQALDVEEIQYLMIQSYDEDAISNGSIEIRKARVIQEVTAVQTKSEFVAYLNNFWDALYYIDLEVKYTDGTSEQVSYGQVFEWQTSEGIRFSSDSDGWRYSPEDGIKMGQTTIEIYNFSTMEKVAEVSVVGKHAHDFTGFPLLKEQKNVLLDFENFGALFTWFIPNRAGEYYDQESHVLQFYEVLSSGELSPVIYLNLGTKYLTVVMRNNALSNEVNMRLKGDSHDHTYTSKIARPATCVADGEGYQECTICGEEGATIVIPATGHRFTQEVIVKVATCGVNGSKRMDCVICKAHGVTSTIPATGKHTYGAYVTTKVSTAVATGLKTHTCTVVGCNHKETVIIPKLVGYAKFNFSGTLPLKVKQSTTAVKVTMEKGDSVASWNSSNTKVATVSKTGKITGKKAGTATIKVTLKSGVTKSFKVKVTKAAVKTTSVKLNMKKVTLKKGKKVTLVATLAPITTAEKVKFSTSNNKVATVTSKGVIQAKKKGTATITVRVGNKKATCKVTVK